MRYVQQFLSACHDGYLRNKAEREAAGETAAAMWGGEIADIVRSLCNCLVLIVGTDALHRHCPHAAVLAELSAPTPRTPSPRASGRYTMSASASASSVQTRAGSPIKPSEDPLGLGALGESETASTNWLERQPSNYQGHRAGEGRWALAGSVLHTWKGHSSGVLCADIHPSELTFATGGKDCLVKCWTTDTAKCKTIYRGHRNAVRDCFFVGGSGEVMASNDGALHVWDPDPGQRLLNFESEASPFTAFRPLPNPFTLAAATQESVWMIDVRAGAQVADWGLPCLQPPPSAFAAKPLRSVRATVVTVGGGDGDEGKPWVAVGDSGGGMCVLDARMGLVLYRWKVNSESGVSHAETVPGMPHMLLTAAERTLTVWDLSGNAPVALRSFQPHGAEAITALAPHPPYFGLSTAGHRVAATPLPPYDSTADEAQPRAVRIAGDAGGVGGPAAKGPFVKPTQVSNLALLPLHQVALVGYDDGTLKICH